jgi:hypothetical protein
VTTDPTVVSEAYSTARELLRQAEADAARIRADADRYKRSREQEAELLVAKARRLLTMAEERAAAIRRGVVDLEVPATAISRRGVALDAPAPAPGSEPRVGDGAPRPGVAPASSAPRVQTALDAILANAVSNAVHRALPADD